MSASNVVTSTVRSYTVDTAFISGDGAGDYYETAIRKGGHNWIVVNNSWTELPGALGAHNEWVKTILLNQDEDINIILHTYEEVLDD